MRAAIKACCSQDLTQTEDTDARTVTVVELPGSRPLAWCSRARVGLRPPQLDVALLSCPILSPDRFNHLQHAGLAFTRLPYL